MASSIRSAYLALALHELYESLCTTNSRAMALKRMLPMINELALHGYFSADKVRDGIRTLFNIDVAPFDPDVSIEIDNSVIKYGAIKFAFNSSFVYSEEEFVRIYIILTFYNHQSRSTLLAGLRKALGINTLIPSVSGDHGNMSFYSFIPHTCSKYRGSPYDEVLVRGVYLVRMPHSAECMNALANRILEHISLPGYIFYVTMPVWDRETRALLGLPVYDDCAAYQMLKSRAVYSMCSTSYELFVPSKKLVIKLNGKNNALHFIALASATLEATVLSKQDMVRKYFNC